jgi:folate-dependent tRNA-U54 methylase TrmFO/GidA
MRRLGSRWSCGRGRDARRRRQAIAVDRDVFSSRVTEPIGSHPPHQHLAAAK